MRYIYVSQRGGAPYNVGKNLNKRAARAAIFPDSAHQALVRIRHRYYHQQHDEFLRGRASNP